jgi:hypothetical protein
MMTIELSLSNTPQLNLINATKLDQSLATLIKLSNLEYVLAVLGFAALLPRERL